jgi:hypothetical protein
MDEKLNYIEWLRKFADYIEQGDFDYAYLCNMLDAYKVAGSLQQYNQRAYNQFAYPYPEYAKRVLAEVAKLGDEPNHGIGGALCDQYGLEPTHDLVRCKSLRVRFLRELADTAAAKVHSPELVRACHEAIEWLFSPERYEWLCEIADDMADREAGEALQKAVDSALNGHSFLPRSLAVSGLYPKPAKQRPAEWRLHSRLWWLNQILNGHPVPGAAECKR